MVTVEAGIFARSCDGPTWVCDCPFFPFSGRPAWQGKVLDIPVPLHDGELKRLSVVGVFAVGCEGEEFGTHGASIQLWNQDHPLFSVELLHGKHYGDASKLTAPSRSIGDGTGLETMGEVGFQGKSYRVELLKLDLPLVSGEGSTFRLKTMSKGAQFLIFDVFFHFESGPACPFHSKSGGVSLAELGSIVRLGDRTRLSKALNQLEKGILHALDLDEARSQALTFIAIVTAATLEMGGARSLHRLQLDAARRMDTLQTHQEVAHETKQIIESVTKDTMAQSKGPSAHLIDQALAIVNRNFAKNLTYEEVANELGLSPSHFRHLFREATGQPFHRYIVALRLERAKRLLIDHDLAVSEVAASVGFSGLAHFSRAFAQRFQVAPSSVRRASKSIVL